MTDITILKKEGNIVSVTCQGHTGYANCGEDIVCAGISTIVQTALLGILNVAGVEAKYKTDEKKGYLHFELKGDISKGQMHDCQVILKTMLCGLSDFYTEYSDYMKLEVKE